MRQNTEKKDKHAGMENSAVTKVAIHNLQLRRKQLFKESNILDLS